jgi:hypothetical protein
MKHLIKNFARKISVPLSILLWSTPLAATQQQCTYFIEKIQDQDQAAYDYIITDVKPMFWATYDFSNKRYGCLTSNIVENFNS